MSEILDTFAKRLTELMRDKNISIKDLSDATGIPKSTINSWTLRKRCPGIDYLYKVSEYFNVSADYFIGRVQFQ